jgi:sugar lactone lactonase YvrE
LLGCRVTPLRTSSPDSEGNIWTGVDDGRLLRLTADGTGAQVIADTRGRPLSVAVARDGRLLICDSRHGLLRCDPTTAKLETLVTEVAGRTMTFCSNVIESSDGTLYFTESANRFGSEYYKGAVIEARVTGSLFRRDTNGTGRRLGLRAVFANGVMLTADESAVVFAESMGCRLSKYWVTGERAGSIAELVTELPGYPDNIAIGSDGRIGSPWCPSATGSASGSVRAPRSCESCFGIGLCRLVDLTSQARSAK